MEWLVINLVEAILIAWFLSSLFMVVNRKGMYRALIFICNFVVITCSNYINLYDVFLTSFLVVSNTVITTFFAKEELHKIVFIVCLESVLVAFAVAVAILMNSLLPITNISVCSKVIYAALAYLLIHFLKGRQLYFNKQMYYILSSILFALHFVIQHFMQIYILFSYENIDLIIAIILFLVSLVVFLVLFLDVSNLYKTNDSYERLKQEKENEKVLSSLYEEVAIIKHDLKHDYQLLNFYLHSKEYDKATELIETKEKTLMELPSLIHSPNKIITMILNNKLIGAYTKNIQTQCEICVDEYIQINDYDLNELLANILDNAIENCSYNGMIKIKIIQKQEMLHICVENTVEEYSDLKTKKSTKNHGYGLKSIERIVHKYNGSYSITQQNLVFTLDATLLLIEK